METSAKRAFVMHNQFAANPLPCECGIPQFIPTHICNHHHLTSAASMMKAAIAKHAGSFDDNIEIVEVDRPSAGEGELVIKGTTLLTAFLAATTKLNAIKS